MLRKNDSYDQLKQEHDMLSAKIMKYFHDFIRLKELSLLSNTLAEKLQGLANLKKDKDYWILMSVVDLVNLSNAASNNNSVDLLKKNVEIIATKLESLKEPITLENKELYCSAKNMYKHLSENNMVYIKPIKDSEKTSFMPAYFWLNGSHDFYGSKGQDYFCKKSCQIVKDTAGKIAYDIDIRVNKLKPTELFVKLLTRLGSSRREIAIETNTVDADRYGKFRQVFNAENYPEIKLTNNYGEDTLLTQITPLSDRYLTCLYDVKDSHFTNLKKYISEKSAHHEQEFGEFIYTVEVIGPVALFNLLNQCEAECGTKNNKIYYHLFSQFGSKYKDGFIGFIVSTISLKLDDRCYPLTSHVTNQFCDVNAEESLLAATDTLHKYEKDSKGLMFHRGYIQTKKFFMSDLAQLFERAVTCDKNNSEKLINTLAELHYKLAHAMFFLRGSAAISEWIVKSIFKYHGFRLERLKPGIMVDLKALAQPNIRQFIEEYPGFWQRHPTSRQKPLYSGPQNPDSNLSYTLEDLS